MKHIRLVPGKKGLEEVDNPSSLAMEQSLDMEMAMVLHEVAKDIERSYGMRMDIEFVVDPVQRHIHIVQARPIPLGDRKNMKPAATSPEFVRKMKEKGITPIKGEIVTPDVNRAAVISDPSEVIICATIGEALSRYLKNTSGKIKAVIIQKPAADTSHEAGEFNSKAIPVLQVESLAGAQKILDRVGKKESSLILDPQRKSLIEHAPSTEEELYAQGVLKEGIFRSTLSYHVTPYHYRFNTADIEFRETMLSDFRGKSFGDVIREANQGNPEATQSLLSFMYGLMENATPLNTSKFNDVLDDLTTPKRGESNALLIGHVGSIMRKLGVVQRHYEMDKDVFKQVMIAGAEMVLALETLENEPSDEAFTKYLNLYEKFLGTITAGIKRDVLSESFFKELAEKKHAMEMLPKIEGLGFNPRQQALYLQLVKAQKYLINKNDHPKWEGFVRDICRDEVRANKLALMIRDLAKLGILNEWVNVSFMEAYERNGGNPDAMLDSLSQELKASEQALASVARAHTTIRGMKAQIALWQEPANFEKQFSLYQKQLASVRRAIAYDDKEPTLVKLAKLSAAKELVDAMDLSTKALEKSPLYTDKNLQAIRFKQMIIEMDKLMHEWVGFAGYDSSAFYTRRVFNTFLDTVKVDAKLGASDLSPSGRFGVNGATVDRQTPGDEAVSRNHNYSTLEDYFTLVHQNILVSIARLNQECCRSLEQHQPSMLTRLEASFKGFAKDHSDTYDATPVSIQIENGEVRKQYNLPLRNHSAMIEVAQHSAREELTIKFKAFGQNSRNSRWTRASFSAYLMLLSHPNITIISPPRYDDNSSEMEFEVLCKSQSAVSTARYTMVAIAENSFATTPREMLSEEAFADSVKRLDLEKARILLQYLEKEIHNDALELDKFLARVILLYDHLITLDPDNKQTLCNEVLSKYICPFLRQTKGTWRNIVRDYVQGIVHNAIDNADLEYRDSSGLSLFEQLLIEGFRPGGSIYREFDQKKYDNLLAAHEKDLNNRLFVGLIAYDLPRLKAFMEGKPTPKLSYNEWKKVFDVVLNADTADYLLSLDFDKETAEVIVFQSLIFGGSSFRDSKSYKAFAKAFAEKHGIEISESFMKTMHDRYVSEHPSEIVDGVFRHAIRSGYLGLIKTILDSPNRNLVNNNFFYVLNDMRQHPDIEVVRAVFNHPEITSLNIALDDIYKPMVIAAGANDAELLRKMLSYPKIDNNDRLLFLPPLAKAAKKGHMEALAVLMESPKFKTINLFDQIRTIPGSSLFQLLLNVAWKGQIDVVCKLLEYEGLRNLFTEEIDLDSLKKNFADSKNSHELAIHLIMNLDKENLPPQAIMTLLQFAASEKRTKDDNPNLCSEVVLTAITDLVKLPTKGWIYGSSIPGNAHGVYLESVTLPRSNQAVEMLRVYENGSNIMAANCELSKMLPSQWAVQAFEERVENNTQNRPSTSLSAPRIDGPHQSNKRGM